MSLQRVGHYLETEQQQQQLFFIFAVKNRLLHTGVQSQDHTVLHVKIFQLQPVGWTEAYDLGLDCQSIPSPGQVKRSWPSKGHWSELQVPSGQSQNLWLSDQKEDILFFVLLDLELWTLSRSHWKKSCPTWEGTEQRDGKKVLMMSLGPWIKSHLKLVESSSKKNNS